MLEQRRIPLSEKNKGVHIFLWLAVFTTDPTHTRKVFNYLNNVEELPKYGIVSIQRKTYWFAMADMLGEDIYENQ